VKTTTVRCLRRYAVFLLALSLHGYAAAQADSFDVPEKKMIVDLGPVGSPYSPGGNTHRKLTCYFYPTFAVREYDVGQKGAELAIVPNEPVTDSDCTWSRRTRAKLVDWTGGFKGAKGNLVFFDAADGTDGGMPFAVYDSRTGKRIFEDSYYDPSMSGDITEASPFNPMRVENASDDQIILTYLRVSATDCDLHRVGSACWERIKKKFALKSANMPRCSRYEHVTTGWASSIAYPVQVSLFPHPVTKTIDGPVRCWPVD
jgi:hypothetical protein